MEAYNGQRVGAATVALGIAAGAYDQALDYSPSRGTSSAGRSPSSRGWPGCWPTCRSSWKPPARWSGAPPRAGAVPASPIALPAAQAKVMAADTAIEVTNEALQVWGAAGYSRDNPMERFVRDARMFAIAGGTAQVLRTRWPSGSSGGSCRRLGTAFLRQAGRQAAAD